MYKCNSCDSCFSAENSLRSHQRELHQLSVNLGNIKVSREVGGLFRCPIDGTTGRSTKFVRNHRACFLSTTTFLEKDGDFEKEVAAALDGSTSQVPLEATPDLATGSLSTIPSILNNFNLASYRGMIFCIPCRGLLGFNVPAHLKRKHGRTMVKVDFDVVKQCVTEESAGVDFAASNEEIPFLETVDGQYCQTCGWSCTTGKAYYPGCCF